MKHFTASIITDGLDVVRLLLGLGLPGAFAVGASVAEVSAPGSLPGGLRFRARKPASVRASVVSIRPVAESSISRAPSPRR